MIALVLAVALSQTSTISPGATDLCPAGAVCKDDMPLANPHAHGTATVLKPGDDYVNTTGRKVVVLDAQEDVSRESDRVEGRAGEAFWRKVAIGSITGGAVLTLTAVVLGAVIVTHK